jgi:hypothetical protein
MELATVYSQTQFTELHSKVKPWVPAGSSLYWLGGNDLSSEGTWNWPGAHPFTYANWRAGEPNNNAGIIGGDNEEDCLAVWASNGEWNDYGCGWSFSFVCGPSKHFAWGFA